MSSDFANPGSKPGLEIWRIESLAAVPLPAKDFGTFYDGDSYLVLKTTETTGGKYVYDLFFWLGSESSQDEQGAAAYKAVELDDLLGGAPVQHREVQGCESDSFLGCFKKISYEKGGVKSGFRKVERDVYETRLLHVKGSRTVRIKPVAIDHTTLNAGDVFVLDAGLSIYLWNGSGASHKEKAKGLEVALAIKDDERGGRAKLTACDQGAEEAAFWEALGGQGPVAAATPDDSPTGSSKGALKLVRVSDASGSLSSTEVACGDTLERSMLDSKDVFIVDNEAEVFVWVGKEATADEKKGGMETGVKYTAGRPKGVRVTKVSEGAEPALFKSLFKSWKPPATPADFSMVGRSGNVAQATAQASAADLAKGMSDCSFGESEDVADDGSGKTEMFRIEDFEPVPVDQATYGQFFAGDSYIVKYTYLSSGREATLLYFWLGKDSTTDEQGAAALHAKQMDDNLGGQATQVRVTMGKEPPHLVRLFGGKLVVHSGGRASGFKNKGDEDSYDEDGVALYHVKGFGGADSTKAAQVAEVATSLNSGDCFVLLTPAAAFLWAGNGANETEKATAKDSAKGAAKGRHRRNHIRSCA